MKVNHLDYHVEVQGAGEPVLVLHGFSGSSKSFSKFSDLWSQDYQVILVDILGHGNSAKPADYRRYEMDKVAEDLKVILKNLNIAKTHLFGYSMGGRLALNFVFKYPQMIASLILESSSPGLENEEERELRREQDYELATFIEEKGIAEFVSYWDSLPLFNLKEIAKEKKNALHQERLNNDTKGLANSLRGMGTGRQKPLWHALQEIKVPVLLIVGEKDKKYCKIAAEMAKRLPNAQKEVVQEASHIVHLEKPHIFSNLILEFLQGRYKNDN
ncbi:2-succinyl-6-hydroxy-2,4-cyclohexadiene-1-carboxylate synthase [Desulfonispora thiosulfatigenes DSM 11270]|uniref:Putative 2-succinyl-6-hydroxy-2,4-cyclohexadiene-1-carboxylate synthase n=1 Tax=Desulfonispora thiosulfatigenes DSM 11270 TaxID=656914 RepID=A0A1W1UVF9_DESTI|nr:2-succinyl-6-hydroxy-2,4-cyclohexadiene-1-carboxylate synthase [Desulfonispora thiosulfatigenes]SMB84969.1 2-succinyl-6-hydroxy-2,4-cyclohexadiene-1-carboxylate synthase [Desulfonispora thiosulfatigenes DSM 11270]